MERSYTLRPAAATDSAAIRKLIVRSRINPSALNWRRFVVAISSKNKLIGCGQIKPHRDGSHELASIAVEQDWQGHGLGRAIIENLLESSAGVLYLMCRSSMGSLYEKFGFQVITGEGMPKYFQRVSKLVGMVELLNSEGETLLVMRRDSISL